MANFDSGVAKYIMAQATVEVGFPVDFKGKADISCNQCPFLSNNGRTCNLNKEIVEYPARYVGGHCPLVQVIEED